MKFGAQIHDVLDRSGQFENDPPLRLELRKQSSTIALDSFFGEI